MVNVIKIERDFKLTCFQGEFLPVRPVYQIPLRIFGGALHFKNAECRGRPVVIRGGSTPTYQKKEDIYQIY